MSRLDRAYMSDIYPLKKKDDPTQQDRYGLPYTYCGCPLPGTTLGQRLRHALSLHRHRTTDELDVLRPPSDAAASTHPSDHNAVYPMHNRKASERARERRRQKAERRRRRQALDAKDASAVSRYNNCSQSHALAFFYPVPLWIGVASCVTVPFVVDNGACATVRCFALFFTWRDVLTSLVCV